MYQVKQNTLKNINAPTLSENHYFKAQRCCQVDGEALTHQEFKK